MSSEVVIRVEGLASCLASGAEPTARSEGDTTRRGKRYRLGAGRANERYTALRDVITNKAKSFFKKLKTEKLKSGNGADVSESQRLSVSATDDSSVSLRAVGSSRRAVGSTEQEAAPEADSQRFGVSSKEDFWALREVSFEVKQGEVVASCQASGAEPTARSEGDTARRGIIGVGASLSAVKSRLALAAFFGTFTP